MYKKGLKRLVSGVTVFGMMFGMLAPMAVAADNGVQVSAVDYSKVPKLLITELVPDTANVGGADAYEFIEVYNNSNKEIDFKDYNLVYRNAGVDTVWPGMHNDTTPYATMKIPAQSTITLWVTNTQNGTKTVADFNTNFGTNLKEYVNLYSVAGNDGMANTSARGLVIQEKTGTDISIASYQTSAVSGVAKPDKGIFYRYPSDGTKNMAMYSVGEYAATPGVLDTTQVPTIPRMYSEPPVINHTPVTQADQRVDLTLLTQIANPEQNESVSAAVYYKTGPQTWYDSVPMTVLGNTQYQATIPKDKLTDTPLNYYIQADDGFSTVRSNVYSANVALQPTDFTKVPPLLITELVPDSTGTTDEYEFIEVYNNSDKPVNYKDYQLLYRYTGTATPDLIWPADKEDIVIPSKGTLVFWVINASNVNKTAADFNKNYNTTGLVEGTNLVRIRNDGMANSASRGIIVATNTGIEVSSANYVAGDSGLNMGILYKYPRDGKSTMTKYSTTVALGTPGTVDPLQVPVQTVILTPDTIKPVITDLTKEISIEQSNDLEMIADFKDETSLKTAALYYKTEKQSTFTKKLLKESFADTLYHNTIFSPELIGNAYVDYYFVSSDGQNETTTATKRIAITGGSDHSALRLNFKDGDIVAGSKVVKGTGQGLGADDLKLAIDGKDVSSSTYHAVEHNAYFAFEVTGVNYYFKNAVTQGKDILYTFQDTVDSYTTLSTPISADRLMEGSNIFSIRAGSKASPFDTNELENKDNFDVKNVRLVFDDGTIIYDPKYNVPSKVIGMGDSSNKAPVVDFNFTVPAGLLASKAYEWKTPTTNDGEHQITVSNAIAGSFTAKVIVDNSAPTIAPSIEDGKTYRGPFTLDAIVNDELAQVEKVEATLDKQPITLPLATSSAQLPGGKHVFKVKATDKVGNVSEKTINFEVPNENPAQPVLVSPTQGAAGMNSDTELKVQVSDPMNDDMKVSFYGGFKYDASTPGQFTGYRNAADTEPPKQEKPDGEKPFAPEDYEKVSKVDGNYLIDDSDEKFPYQRFEVSLDPAIQSSDKVEINWKGKSLDGRKVTLYAWSPSKQSWSPLKTVIATGETNFELKAVVAAGDYANKGKIQVMVQDQIAVVQNNQPAETTDYDFSFVWMSDTQYYSKGYPHIYQQMVKWIADHKEDNKIKYVIHTGDIVDNADQEYQWVEADKDMKVLEKAGIPYGVLAGNHDVGHQDNDYSYYSKWFGEDRFKNQTTYGESYDNNRGHYDLVSSNGNDFIIIYMGWGYGDKEIDWINGVLKEFPNRKAILNFHEFMLVSNNRAPMAEKVFERVIIPNKNVIAALSGHYHDAQLKIDEMDDNNDGIKDRKVFQMLADYQGAPEGGLGYMRLMQFDLAHDKINMKTYSPYLDDYNFYDPIEKPGKDEFSLDLGKLGLQPVTKRVATDYIGVNVYTDKKIGSVDGVKSGQEVSVVWHGLASSTSYQWYTVAEDVYEGRSQSDIWKFTTLGEDSDSSGGSGGPSVPSNNTEATIPVNGGTATLDGVQIVIPDGAVTSKIKVTVKKLSDAASLPVATTSKLVSAVYEILKDTAGEFNKAIQVTLPFEVSKVDLNQSDVSLYWFNETTRTWVQLDNIVVDKVKGTVTGSVTHFTKFAVIATPKEEGKPGSDGANLTDIKGHWAEASIRELIGQGAINGYPDSTFKPEGRITRAEFVSIVVKFLKLSDQGGKAFSDTTNHWAKDAIATAAANGIISGYTDTTFGPDDTITREQMAVILVRAAHMTDKGTVGTQFTDNSTISEWAQEAVGVLTSKGLLNGYQDGTLKPQGISTRAEASAIILRTLKK
ncbi:S-layer homology domain-containing protein [Paenibacillus qinlingensis]|uniref:Phosphodiesterase n=1 Tax=Paenibacillus qinlingensis TaxID=1837343 RepID=A0ABU1P4I4_9BACL|nr:S-layer homology domain-containing protein [Paenibacillus qinlingensis]MDR6554653.1 putative phosphodiesterase [Paenibacillus qinlingensis]